MPTAALFDVDGTLLDTNYWHTVAWTQALAQYGHHPAMARIHGAIGMGGDQLLDHLLGEDRDRDQDEALSAAHQALFARFWPALRAFDGAGDLLRALKGRGWTVVLASSASARDLAVMRRALDADDAIDAATSADDVEASKPAPDLVRAALAKAGVGPDRAVFVGDTPWDVQAAARAEVPCVAVLSGGTGERALRAAGALEVHADVAELLTGLDDSVLADPARRTHGSR
ncbi:HAD family hydrolase [Kitasatospora purpeofusca]|uniref:HAD family hydrolase n=1 Tax=Kitasatospora purpeofusca TaxID=67352 RepID=UPI002A59C506|nr:HAD family hydrolase [Kitasatospora purpeofusca]MDY0811368.1 HAD family hydrolase [Kitasatospora purpeofusca]